MTAQKREGGKKKQIGMEEEGLEGINRGGGEERRKTKGREKEGGEDGG